MLRLLAILLTLLSAAPALAQTWLSRGLDDGVWFIGFAGPPSYDFIFQCGGRAAQNLPFENSDISEPKLTEPGQIMLSVSPALFDGQPDEITGLSLAVDGTPFPLAPLRYSEFDNFYEVPLDINDPVFARLRAGTTAGILWNGQWIARDISLSGSSDAIRTMAQACVTGWAALPRSAPVWSAQTILAEAARYCDGPAKVDFDYISIRDLDGDSHPDLILDMGAVECTEGESWERRGAGMCGASHCSNFVYLSQSPFDEPQEILSIGTRIVTDQAGQLRINGGGGLGQCSSEGFDACEYQFDPTSGTLEYLGLVPYNPE